jgi:hypothetical protein
VGQHLVHVHCGACAQQTVPHEQQSRRARRQGDKGIQGEWEESITAGGRKMGRRY